MTSLSLPVIEKTLQKTRQWLDEVMADLETTDRAKAYRALRAVLHAIRDNLNVDEASNLASQLPLLVRGIYYEGWKPSVTPYRIRNIHDFVARVGQEFGDYPTLDLEKVCRSVYRVLSRHISPGEMDDVRACLPTDIRDFLESDHYPGTCQPVIGLEL